MIVGICVCVRVYFGAYEFESVAAFAPFKVKSGRGVCVCWLSVSYKGFLKHTFVV